MLAPRTQMGININITFSGQQPANQIAMAAAAGVSSIRVPFYLNQFENTQGVYNFALYESIVSLAELHGIKILALMAMHGTPTWALDPATPGSSFPTPAIYQTFCQQISSYFGSRINLYEMGNEPNEKVFWLPAWDPVGYVAVMKAGYAGLKAGNPNCTAILGGLAGFTDSFSGHDSCVDFITQIYANSGKNYFDAFGFHPYPMSPDTNLSDPNFAALDLCTAVMATNSDSGKLIYLTEIGYYTGTAANFVTEAQQALDVTNLYTKVLTGSYQAIPTIWWYQLADNGSSISSPEDNYGIVHNTSYASPLLPKASFYNFQNLAFPTLRDYKFLPLKSGNCLSLSATGDMLGGVTFSWGSKYSCFFKANMSSITNPASRIIDGNTGNTFILLTSSSIQVNNGGTSVTSASGVLILNEWHDYGIVYDSNFVRFYRDGVMVDCKKLTVSPSTSPQVFTIFNRADGQRPCSMNVCEFQWYNREIAPLEITQHYYSDPNNTDSLVIRYKLHEGSGVAIADSSGNGYNATLIGGSWTTFSQPAAQSTYGDVPFSVHPVPSFYTA